MFYVKIVSTFVLKLFGLLRVQNVWGVSKWKVKAANIATIANGVAFKDGSTGWMPAGFSSSKEKKTASAEPKNFFFSKLFFFLVPLITKRT